MKGKKNRFTGIIMTAVMLLSAVLPTGCKTREAKDIERIEDVTEQFIEAYGSGDSKELKDLVEEDFKYNISFGDNSSILLKIASKTQIESFENVEIDRENNTAKARVRLSLIDIPSFTGNFSNSYMKEETYLDEIDNYKDRKTVNLTFKYIYDEEEDRWIIKERTADKYEDFFDMSFFIHVVKITPDEALELFTDIIEGFAKGQFEQPAYKLHLEDIRSFDDEVYNEPILKEAIEEFTKAYFTYVVEHGFTFEVKDDYPYNVIFHGTAPSKEALLEYMTSDEHIIEMYMFTIRAANGYYGKTTDEIWSEMYAEIYFDLAKKIPDMEGQDYDLEFMLNGGFDGNPEVTIFGKLITATKNDVFACTITNDQSARCYQKAVENLYFAGELTQEQYEKYLSEINNTVGIEPDYDEAIETFSYTI